MKLEELDNLRNSLHKQFINRLPANAETVKILVGIGDGGVTAEKSELLKALAQAVADGGLNNVLCCFETAFEGGLHIVKPNGETVAVDKACAKCAGEIVAKYLA